jgi:hypothetical protein
MKDSNKFGCQAITNPSPTACACDYRPPVITNLLVREKEGRWQVRINGKGKWLNAEMGIGYKSISFSY